MSKSGNGFTPPDKEFQMGPIVGELAVYLSAVL